MDNTQNFEVRCSTLDERVNLFSDTQIILMLLGGSLVAFAILFVAYIIHTTNIKRVVSWFKRSIIDKILPPSDSVCVQTIVYVQIILFCIAVIWNRAKTIAWFSVYGPSVSRGEIYRFFTSSIVHADIFHLYNNLRAITTLGNMLEKFSFEFFTFINHYFRCVGKTKFFIIFALSNTAGGVSSFFWSPLTHSFGAHVAVFGILGSLFYIYYFKAKLWKDALESSDKTVDEKLSNESMMFILRYVLIGILLERIALFSSLCGLVIGFIGSMVLSPKNTSGKNKWIISAIAALLLGIAIALSQREEIFNIEMELKNLEKCKIQAEAKTKQFLELKSLNSDDYYEKRNFAYEVQRYSLPQWRKCYNEAIRVKEFTMNKNIVPKQLQLLNNYIQLFHSSKRLWSFYSSTFQEDTDSILRKRTQEKTTLFMKRLSETKESLKDLVFTEHSTPWFYNIWICIVCLALITTLIVRTFPCLRISQVITYYWNMIILMLVSKASK